jgi:tetratricopeptide (TPR) repeat protein
MRLAVILITVLLAASASAQPMEVGSVSFANSGAPAAQEAFRRGLAQLHNFEYSSAAEWFRKAQEIDPSFAMAFWGEAMTHTHPIWFQQDRDAARAVLAKAPKAKTERERDYLQTLEVLYGEGTKNERDFKYANAMEKLHAKYPDDVDATAFYALALLGTAHEGRDFRTYMRAASLLEEVFPANRRHPGVLHYLIHSYDDPIHAPLGMRAARLYGDVAPHAGHALHMTSHIFVAMGMWDDVIDANRRAIAVVNEQRAAKSKPPADCGHYPTWLHYGYLQRKRFDDARKALDACRVFALAATERGPMNEYADMVAAHAAAGQAVAAADIVEAKTPAARFTLAYAAVLAAAQRGEANAVEHAVARLRDLEKPVVETFKDDTNPAPRMRAEIMLQQAEALLLIAQGKRAEALPILEAAAKKEKAMPFEFGPPEIPKPAAELLAEQLLAAGRKDDAAAAYRMVLERAPGRAQSAVHVH